MDDEQPPPCPFCGKPHHTTLGDVVPSVPGSRMRRGGSFTCASGITIGTDEWSKVRCVFCKSEAMTPIEMIAPHTLRDTDGAYLGHCGSCQFDLASGYKPMHNPNRSRRRRRH